MIYSYTIGMEGSTFHREAVFSDDPLTWPGHLTGLHAFFAENPEIWEVYWSVGKETHIIKRLEAEE